MKSVAEMSDPEFMKYVEQQVASIPPTYACTVHGEYASHTPDGAALVFECLQCESAARKQVAEWQNAHRASLAWRNCGLAKRYWNRSLDNWRPRSESLRDVLAAVHGWKDQLGTGDVSALVLSGGVGLGKTHLAAGLMAWTLARGLTARYVSLPDLLSDLRASYNRESDIRTEDVLNPLRDAALLVLDEIGVQRGTEWELDLLAQLIDERYRDAPSMALVLLTNASPEELPRFIGARAADRIREWGLTLRLSGESYRAAAPDDEVLRTAPELFPAPSQTLEVSRTVSGKPRVQIHELVGGRFIEYPRDRPPGCWGRKA